MWKVEMMEVGLSTCVGCAREVLDESMGRSTTSRDCWWGVLNPVMIELS